MEVIIYTTPDCPHCSSAKSYLKKKNIEFVEYDVSKDEKKAREMVVKSRQGGVPVLQINGRIVVGFQPDEIDKALSRQKYNRATLIGNIILDPFDL